MKYLIFVFVVIILHISINKSFANILPDSIFESLEKQISTNSDSILEICLEQIKFAKAQHDSLTIAKASYIIGKYYIVRTYEYPLAYDYFFRALNNFKLHNSLKDEAKCEMQIGLIYYLVRNFNEAIINFNSAFDKMLQVGDSMRIGRLAFLKSITYSEKKDLSLALLNLNVAKAYQSDDQANGINLDITYGYGIYFLNAGNGDSALKYLFPLFEKSIERNDHIGIQRFGAEIASSYELKGDVNKAVTFASRVVSMEKNFNTGYAFMSCYYILYKYALEHENFNKAVKYLNQYIMLKDSIINENNLFELASIKTKFFVEKEKRESDLREARQLAIIEKQKTLKIIFILSGIFLLIFVFALKKKNKQLALSYDKLKSTQEQLINQEKLASMGKLSAGIAHEMLNPLNFVKGFTAAMKEMLDDIKNISDEQDKNAIINDAKNLVGKVTEHSSRMESSVKQIISHIQINPGKNEWTEINPLCDLYISLVTNSLTAQQKDFNYKITKNYSPDLPKLFINAHEIGRVLTNILTNAFQALDDKLKTEHYVPEISIRTFVQNNFVTIEISDNGVGITSDNIGKIFDDFYTTRLPGKGVGLGLSVARDIIRSYGGKVSAQSAGGLTAFRIELPASDFRSN